MRIHDLRSLFDFHYWATRHLLGVTMQLTPEHFTHPVAGSYGSVRNTLVHILSAEWGWLERCGGPRRGERLKAQDFPEADALVRAWARVEDYVRAFLSGLGDADLSRHIEFAVGGGLKQSLPLGDLMQHAALHAMHHRGQAALLLRMLGYEPGGLDFLLYLVERKSPLDAEP
jgi:uncharacterized damage-inducible protein DinB